MVIRKVFILRSELEFQDKINFKSQKIKNLIS